MLKNYKARERQTRGCVASATVLFLPANKIDEIKNVNSNEVYVSAQEKFKQKRIQKENYRKNDKRRDLARAKAREERGREKLMPIIGDIAILLKDKAKEDFEETLFDLCNQRAEKEVTRETINLMKELGYYTADLETRKVKDGVEFTKEEEIALETEMIMFCK